jgi:hypothetical protein
LRAFTMNGITYAAMSTLSRRKIRASSQSLTEFPA